jgi:hypothetical protein
MQDKKPETKLQEDNGVIVPTMDDVRKAIEEHAESRNHPYATQTEPGFVTLSNETDSDSEITVATSSAVKKVYDLANTANKNASNANDNANTRLSKEQNGADISDKTVFINNLGLRDTVKYAENALPRESIQSFTSGAHRIQGGHDYANLELAKTDGQRVLIQTLPHVSDNMLLFSYGSQVLFVPKKNGTLATVDNVNQAEIRANNNANTRLEKSKNGADIPDKAAFVKNIGLEGAAIQNQSVNFAGVMVTGSDWRNFLIRHNSGLDVNFGSQGEYGYVILKTYPCDEPLSSFIFPKGVFGTVLTTGNKSNTYIDLSGHIKISSPIIKIWENGRHEVNQKATGATVVYLSKGTYLIKGVNGFNNDEAIGSIEIPRCQNDLPMVWVNHEVLPDGSIKLMTYHREHKDVPVFARNVRKGYSDGDLIDIPDGRFISVRVQMPASE